MGNPPLEVAAGQRRTHVNTYEHQTVHRGKVDPWVTELPRGNELSWDHVNRPLSLIFTHAFCSLPATFLRAKTRKQIEPKIFSPDQLNCRIWLSFTPTDVI